MSSRRRAGSSSLSASVGETTPGSVLNSVVNTSTVVPLMASMEDLTDSRIESGFKEQEKSFGIKETRTEGLRGVV